MASGKQQETMLLTEHFTWPPISLIDDIINAVNEVLYRCTDTFESGLSAADPSLLGFSDRYAAEKRTPSLDDGGNPVFPEARLEIEEGILKLETLMEGAVDRNFDRLEIWTLRNVLCLPREEGVGDWVRLGHYANLQVPPKENTLTPEALHVLRRKLVETKKLHTALLAEKTRNDAQIARLRSLLQPPPPQPKQESRSSTGSNIALPTAPQPSAPFAFLTHTPAVQNLGVQPLPATTSTTATQKATGSLATHTTFTTSQLPHLKQLVASLKQSLPSTALPAKDSEKGEWTRERRVYVESQSRRVLERRGVDTRDGVEGVVEGSRVRVDEVVSLEGIVGALGSGKERGEDGGEAMDTS